MTSNKAVLEIIIIEKKLHGLRSGEYGELFATCTFLDTSPS